MAKKIGILTLHFGYNYGGVLQSYALMKVLQSLGYDTKIIDYHSKSIFSFFIGFPFTISIKSLKMVWLKIRYHNCCKKTFSQFRKENLQCTKRIKTNKIAAVANLFDTIIVGSDQVWNPSQHKRNVYFLDWKPDFKGRKVSYAPCCAINKVEKNYRKKITVALHDFDFISVRNQETFDFIKDLIAYEPLIVADPTLLCDFVEFKKRRLISHDYILTYILGSEIQGGHQSVLNLVKSRFPQMPVYSIILTENNPQILDFSDKTLYNVSPNDWIKLILYSSFFYTDSFHGVLFALKYHRPFIGFYSEGLRASRFIDMKNKYRLKRQIIKSVSELKSDLNEIIEFDYSFVDKVIQEQKEISLLYLKNALEGSKK
jgi:hypothetical protein